MSIDEQYANSNRELARNIYGKSIFFHVDPTTVQLITTTTGTTVPPAVH